MGTQLVREVLYRVSTLLGDTAPQFVKWTERELVMWLNDAQRVLVKYLPAAGARIDALKLQPGTRQSLRRVLAANQKPGDGSTAADRQGMALYDVIANAGIDGQTMGAAVRLARRRDLDAINPLWHVTPGDGTITHYVYDPRTPTEFFVEPGVPAATACWALVSWQANPVDIPNTGTLGANLYAYNGSSTATLSIDDQYEDDAVAYVAARAWLKDPEAAANAVGYLQQFLTSINAQAKAMTGTNPNLKALPLATEPAAAAS